MCNKSVEILLQRKIWQRMCQRILRRRLILANKHILTKFNKYLYYIIGKYPTMKHLCIL